MQYRDRTEVVNEGWNNYCSQELSIAQPQKTKKKFRYYYFEN